ncbi:MAG: NUDIX domain-containing protein [Phycisphaeraceae bacterium]|nr:NUDIX domain-containing protein [Phycisphaeraceae bacterium]
MSSADGDNSYRINPAGGPRIRSDVVDVYIFQRSATPPRPVVGASAMSGSWGGITPDTGADPVPGIYFLQVLRARDPLGGTWQPVMGHCEKGETAVQCALRELEEEVGLTPPPRGRGQGGGPKSDLTPAHFLSLWALEQVHPFFIAELDAIVMSPRFAAEVSGGGAGAGAGWSPRLNDEHTAHRWVNARDAVRASGEGAFMWPGQRAAAREIVESLMVEGTVNRGRLRID